MLLIVKKSTISMTEFFSTVFANLNHLLMFVRTLSSILHTMISVSMTPPWLSLGFLMIKSGSFPQFSRSSFSSSFLVLILSRSKSTSLVKYVVFYESIWETYFAKNCSSTLVFGLATVSIFQSMVTPDRSDMFTWNCWSNKYEKMRSSTCLISAGQGLANW